MRMDARRKWLSVGMVQRRMVFEGKTECDIVYILLVVKEDERVGETGERMGIF